MQGCETTFRFGSPVPAAPHDSHHYHVVAHRCGYGDDILAYLVAHSVTPWRGKPRGLSPLTVT